MKRPRNSETINLSFVPVLLLAWLVMPVFAQQDPVYSGIVEDWTHHHVVFSNPGSMEDAIRKGKYDEWRRLVTDRRYRLQWMKRYGMHTESTAIDSVDAPQHSRVRFPDPGLPTREPRRGFKIKGKQLHGDWKWDLSLINHGVAIDMYPAKYTFAPVGTPDCTKDFIVFPIDAAGSAAQGEILGLNNLYTGTCTTGSIPNELFSYNIGNGDVQTSPVLSLNGTKVAFVESIPSGSIFHVLTMDMSGNAGCPLSKPCNGTSYSSPAVPGVNNSAVDTKIVMSGGVSDTHSSPFVDYDNDVAYVGDDTGRIHKFTGMFNGVPAEAGSPWPFTVASGVILTGVIEDTVSQHIFVGGNDGNLYCITSAGAVCSTPSISVASGTSPEEVSDEPIVDSTAGTVFAAASNSTNAVLMQATTSLGSPVRATMGAAGTDLYHGAFDNAYFTDISTGHMYFCGNRTNAATPTLWRVTFNSSGTMSSTNDGGSFQLVRNGAMGRADDCTPLTEVYNSSQNKDYLFLGVTADGFFTGTPNCNSETCLINFALPMSAPFTFPSTANATATNDTLNLGNHGMSGIIVDNVSGLAGASQIYFSNLEQSTAVQASQSALQ